MENKEERCEKCAEGKQENVKNVLKKMIFEENTLRCEDEEVGGMRLGSEGRGSKPGKGAEEEEVKVGIIRRKGV